MPLPYDAAMQYCTMWFDSFTFLWFHWNWGICCYNHDVAYSLQLVPKIVADGQLFLCVSHATAWAFGEIMFLGVTLFGGPFYLRARRKRLNHDAKGGDE